jgi:hypothetical protein
MGRSPSSEAHLGEYRHRIRIIDIALDVLPHGDIVELGKERDEPDIPVDDLLKPPQLGMALR